MPERDPAAVAAARTRLVGRLRLHLQQEESTLLPAWTAHQGEVAAPGRADVLHHDHELLRRHLATLEGTPVHDHLARAEVLGLLQGVLEHHDAREARYLKPALDAALPPEVVRRWLDRFEAEEATLEDALPELPPLGQAPPPPPLPDDPLEALRVALATDGPVAAALDRLEPVVRSASHPKARRHYESLRGLVADGTSLAARRDALAAGWDRARLLALTLR